MICQTEDLLKNMHGNSCNNRTAGKGFKFGGAETAKNLLFFFRNN